MSSSWHLLENDSLTAGYEEDQSPKVGGVVGFAQNQGDDEKNDDVVRYVNNNDRHDDSDDNDEDNLWWSQMIRNNLQIVSEISLLLSIKT